MVLAAAMVEADFIVGLVRRVLPDAEVHPRDTTGTGDHWHVTVVDAGFEGLRTFQRQKRVMEPFKPYIQSDVVHALDLVTLTPAEFAARRNQE